MVIFLHNSPPIVDPILDALSEDDATLASCSLVCRQWVNASRLRLFQTVRISKGTDRLAGFTDLLESSEIIREAIRRLIIAPATSCESHVQGIPLAALIYLILTKLPNLTALTLQYIPLRYWVPDLHPRTIRLKQLFIGSLISSGDLESEIQNFLGLYEKVEVLCIGDIRQLEMLDQAAFPRQTSPPSRLPVETLIVEEPHVLPALRHALCPRTLRSLSVRLGRWATTTTLDVIFQTRSFLECYGPSLRHLDIHPTPFSIPALWWPWHELGVSFCTSLESLVFYISMSTRSSIYTYQPYSWNPLVVLQGISSPLRKMRIRFQIVGDRDDIPNMLLTAVRWERLDALVARYRETLEVVEFEMAYERLGLRELKDECDIVESKLPQLATLGLLRFV